MLPDLSIIIVNWHSQTFVRQCLTSVHEHAGSLQYETLVVDNASYDGVAQMLAKDFPSALFIQSDSNLGFSGANNLALARCHGKYVLFLNPDTEIQGDALQEMVSALESLPKVGLVGCRLLNSDRSLQSTCVTAVPRLSNQLFDCELLKSMLPHWTIWGRGALWNPNPFPQKVEAISGACMMGLRETIQKLNGFSTDYFMYAEDMDLCVRTTLAGLAIYYVPAATIIHHGGGSSARRESSFSSVRLRVSLVHFFKVHRGNWYAACYRVSMALMSLLRIFLLIGLFPLSAVRKGCEAAAYPIEKWWTIFLWSIQLFPATSTLEESRPAPSSSTPLHVV